MLQILPIVPISTSQKYYLLFLFYSYTYISSPIIPILSLLYIVQVLTSRETRNCYCRYYINISDTNKMDNENHPGLS